jgi:hypothetical protein
MNVKLAVAVAAVLVLGCGIRTRYIGRTVGPSKPTSEVRVFFGDQPIPAGYVEVGRVFTRFGPKGGRDPGGQVEAIHAAAAEHGADAVIVYETRSELSSFKSSGVAAPGGPAVSAASGTSGVEVRYYGIALRSERTGTPAP